MTDHEHIERQLHDAAGEIRVGTSVPSKVRRRIKLRRLGTVATGLAVVAALAFGGSYAMGAFRSAAPVIDPAEDNRRSLVTQLFADFGNGERVVLELDPAAGAVCYSAEIVTTTERTSLTRIDIVEDVQDKIPVVSFGWDTPVPEPTGCEVNLDKELVGRIIDLPHEYFLLLVRPGEGVSVSALSLEAFEQPDLRCGPPVDFEPTYLPNGWIRELQAGEGGGGEFPGIVGHFGNDAPASSTEKASGGFADLIAEERFYAQGNTEQIRVLDGPATLGDIHEGYSVEFRRHGCDYFLVAYGLNRDELERFAEGLRMKSAGEAEQESDEDFAAIWPEDNIDDARAACELEANEPDSWRRNALTTSFQFANRVLEWRQPRVIQLELGHGGQKVEIRRSERDDGEEAEGPAVLVYLTEVAADCWSVFSVSRLPHQEPKDDGSMTVRGRDVSMSFDLDGASSAIFEVGYGGQKTTYEWRGGEQDVEFQLDFDPKGTGHFLVLMKSSDGEIFSAFGSALPEGDFAAG
jgi:hypothetical protein